jgi:3-(methylthio)propanoyl-CoA dehydrogenase
MSDAVRSPIWHAPVDDLRFVIDDVVGWERADTGDYDPSLTGDILAEAARFAGEVLAPLDAAGDRAGVRWDDGRVSTAPGLAQAYRAFCANGWHALDAPVGFGGQGLPHRVTAAVDEIWCGANLSFSLAPMLTSALAATLVRHGSAQQQAQYVARLVSGEWTGAMNLTEPQAGSDLAQVRTRAVPDPAAGPDSFRLHGTKIYITWGEHDLADNIVHLVLAREAGAPEGVRGLSLFVVPAWLPDGDGGQRQRNDVRCVSLERKLGLHACPTAVMAYGDGAGALGSRVGEAQRGLEYMFTMMNRARIAVGIEGVALSERALQLAHRHALDRVQGRALDGPDATPAAIVEHPDVRRMLLSMRVSAQAGRAFALETAMLLDAAGQDPAALLRLELFTPIVKGWCTEQAVLNASLGIQVHGGMGYIEDTGAAQVLRDARITPIYEGTTAIQANDFLWRKLVRDDGAALRAWIDEVEQCAAALDGASFAGARTVARSLAIAATACSESVVQALRAAQSPPPGRRTAAAGAVPLLELAGVVAAGWMSARAALAAQRLLAAGDPRQRLLERKLGDARFIAANLLPLATVLQARAGAGAASILDADLGTDSGS